MFCRKCGVEIRPTAKFCAKCGTPVKVPEAVKPAEEKKATVIELGPVTKATAATPPVAPVAAKTEPAEEPKLVINMPGMKESSSNGQFNDWFSDAGDL